MPVPWRRGWSLQGVCWGLGRQHLAPVAWPPPEMPCARPSPPCSLTRQQPEGLTQSETVSSQGPLPQHTGQRTVQPGAGTGVGGSCHRKKARGGECSSPGPMGPWSDGHPSAAEHLPGSLGTRPPPRRRPCNVSRCPVGFWPPPQASCGQGNSTPPTRLAGACPYEAHSPSGPSPRPATADP